MKFILFLFISFMALAQENVLISDSSPDQTLEEKAPLDSVDATVDQAPTTTATQSQFLSPIFFYDEKEQVRDLSNDWVTVIAGIGLRGTNWKHSVKKNNTHSSYSIEDATYTSYEGNLSFNKLITKVGFSIASEDEVISKIKKYSGYLGIGNMFFRSESGKFKGFVDYTGFSTNNISKRFYFDQKYTYAEAVYFFEATPFFAGLRRTKWKLPLEIVALKKDQLSGQTVFDKDFEFSYTSLSIGMDYMTQVMLNPIHFRSGWGMLGKVTGNYGWGNAKIGSTAALDATRIYGGGKHFTEEKFGMLTAEMEASLGIMYAKAWKHIRIVTGAGYNYNLFAISSMAKKATSATELSPVAMVMFHNHGPIFRFQALF